MPGTTAQCRRDAGHGGRHDPFAHREDEPCAASPAVPQGAAAPNGPASLAEECPETERERYLVNRLRSVEAVAHEYERREAQGIETALVREPGAITTVDEIDHYRTDDLARKLPQGAAAEPGVSLAEWHRRVAACASRATVKRTDDEWPACDCGLDHLLAAPSGPLRIDRPAEWWLALADREGDHAVGAGAAAEPTREEDEVEVTVGPHRFVRWRAYGWCRVNPDGSFTKFAADAAWLDTIAALRQSLASAEARERALRIAVHEFLSAAENVEREYPPYADAIAALRAALSPSPSEPAPKCWRCKERPGVVVEEGYPTAPECIECAGRQRAATRKLLNDINAVLRDGLTIWPKIADRVEFARECVKLHREQAAKAGR